MRRTWFSQLYQSIWLILWLLCVPLTASAVSSEHLENQIDTYQALEAKQGLAEEEFARQVTDTEATLKAVEESLAATHDKITAKENELKSAETEITAKIEQLSLLKSEQDDSLIRLYELGTPSTAEMLTQTHNLSEIEDRTEYISAFQIHLKTLITSISQVKTELEAKQQQLKHDQASLAGLKAQQEAQKTGLQDERQRTTLLKEQASELKDQYQSLAVSAQAKKKQFDDQIASSAKSNGSRVTRGRVKEGDVIGYMGATGYCWSPEGGFGSRSCAHTHFSILKNGDYVNPRSVVGKHSISWPFDNFVVSQEYGTPNWEANYHFHNGVDLVAEDGYGAPIHAAADGTIIDPYPEYNGWMPDGYGKYVVIDHGGGIWSLYGHLVR